MTLTEAKKFLEKNGYLVETDNRPGFYDYPLIMAITYKGHTIYCGAEDGDMWSDDKEDAYIWKNYDLISTIAVDNFIAVAKEVFETKYIDEDRVEYIPAKKNDKDHTEKKDIMDLLTSERVDLIRQAWNSGEALGNSKAYMKYFNKLGYDTSNYDLDEFHRCWDLACDEDDVETEDEDFDTSIDDIEDKNEANQWLNRMLNKYGNTYHFPEEVKRNLDRLIKKFGNTYFWNR